jgi:hypothetical protein
MPKIKRGQLLVGLVGGVRMLAVGVAVPLAAGCDERERLIFQTPSDGVGPVTTIDQPNGADTTVFAGADFFINGRTIDPDGVDTVYFFVIGGNQGFQPFHPNPVKDTVTFGIPITTFGHSGQTFTIQIHGVDALGNAGGTSTRQIHIR